MSDRAKVVLASVVLLGALYGWVLFLAFVAELSPIGH